MAFFDNIVPVAPRPLCPICGHWAGRPGDEAGRLMQPHDRADQAMRVDAGNPCPGEGLPSVISA